MANAIEKLKQKVESEHMAASQRAGQLAKAQREARHLQAALKFHKAQEQAARLQLHLTAPKGAKVGVTWGLSKVGVHEQPAFSNRGPQIDEWLLACGVPAGNPWCQAFANAILHYGGGVQLKSAFTPQVLQWGKEKKNGLVFVGGVDHVQLGDFLFYKWPGVSSDSCDHVGTFDGSMSLEGNTSPADSGSQNNGGCVARHSLDERRPYCVGVVRPTY